MPLRENEVAAGQTVVYTSTTSVVYETVPLDQAAAVAAKAARATTENCILTVVCWYYLLNSN